MVGFMRVVGLPSSVLSSLVLLLALAATPSSAAATVYSVAASGGDFTVIQDALAVAVAGDTVEVHEKLTPYFERLVFPRSGSAASGTGACKRRARGATHCAGA